MAALELLALSCSSLELMDQATNYNCPFPSCQREFTSKRNLVDHCRGHHQGKKPHSCSWPGCGKSFLRPAHLVIHNRTHTGEKPFMCEYDGCGKRWNQKSALKQHLRCHTGEKPFQCNVAGCNKAFSTSSSCKRHILTHQKPNALLIKRRESSPVSSCSSDDEEYMSPSNAFKREDDMECESAPSSPTSSLSPPSSPLSFSAEEPRKMKVNFILN